LRVKRLAEPPVAHEIDEDLMIAEAAEIAESLGADMNEPTKLPIELGDALIGESATAAKES